MAQTTRYGRCSNKAQCSLAFNREVILVPPDGLCPECGRPLKVNSAFSKIMRWLMLLIFLGALGAGGYYVKKNYLDSGQINISRIIGSQTTSPKPGTDTTPNGTVDPTETPAPTAGPIAEPVYKETAANIQARKDVLKRIDKMPHLSDDQRAKLTEAVGRARNMGCIFIIPFQNGQKTLDSAGNNILVSGFKSAAIQQLLKDPTVVFVVLGYADKTGDAASNERVSYERAQSVLTSMKDRCGVVNVTYGVAMGGSDMFDGKSATKNRLVEIWAAFP